MMSLLPKVECMYAAYVDSILKACFFSRPSLMILTIFLLVLQFLSLPFLGEDIIHRIILSADRGDLVLGVT